MILFVYIALIKKGLTGAGWELLRRDFHLVTM